MELCLQQRLRPSSPRGSPWPRHDVRSLAIETLRWLELAFALQAAAKMRPRVRSFASRRAADQKTQQPKATRASEKFDFAAVSWSPGTAHSVPDPGGACVKVGSIAACGHQSCATAFDRLATWSIQQSSAGLMTGSVTPVAESGKVRIRSLANSGSNELFSQPAESSAWNKPLSCPSFVS